MTIVEVYERYNHLDKFLSDRSFCDELQRNCLYDCWQAIRAAAQGESAPTGALPPLEEVQCHVEGERWKGMATTSMSTTKLAYEYIRERLGDVNEKPFVCPECGGEAYHARTNDLQQSK